MIKMFTCLRKNIFLDLQFSNKGNSIASHSTLKRATGSTSPYVAVTNFPLLLPSVLQNLHVSHSLLSSLPHSLCYINWLAWDGMGRMASL